MIEPKIEFAAKDGVESLRIDVGNYGVDIGWPADPETIGIAIGVLMDKLAGIPRIQIEMEAMKVAFDKMADAG